MGDVETQPEMLNVRIIYNIGDGTQDNMVPTHNNVDLYARISRSFIMRPASKLLNMTYGQCLEAAFLAVAPVSEEGMDLLRAAKLGVRELTKMDEETARQSGLSEEDAQLVGAFRPTDIQGAARIDLARSNFECTVPLYKYEETTYSTDTIDLSKIREKSLQRTGTWRELKPGKTIDDLRQEHANAHDLGKEERPLTIDIFDIQMPEEFLSNVKVEEAVWRRRVVAPPQAVPRAEVSKGHAEGGLEARVNLLEKRVKAFCRGHGSAAGGGYRKIKRKSKPKRRRKSKTKRRRKTKTKRRRRR